MYSGYNSSVGYYHNEGALVKSRENVEEWKTFLKTMLSSNQPKNYFELLNYSKDTKLIQKKT